MKGIEQAQLLAAVHAVEGVVNVEHDAFGHLPGTRRSIARTRRQSSACGTG
jgi:hypothetical protein